MKALNNTMVISTYNIQLQMSDTTHNYWLSLLNHIRDAYNQCANMVASAGIPLSLVAVHALCYDKLRADFPQLPSQAVIRVQKAVLAAFRSIKKNKHKNADTPQRKKLALQLDKRLYSRLSSQGIALSNGIPQKREFCTFVSYDKAMELFKSCSFADPTIFARDGKLFLSVPFEVPTPPCGDDTSIGVDLGMKRLFVTSEGKFYSDKEYLSKRRKLRYLKRCLQGKDTRSSKRHLAKVSRKEYNLSKDMQHRAAKALIESTNASVLVLEDLKKLKQNTSKTDKGFNRSRHNNAISQVPFASFKDILTHKAQLVGKRVETVSPTWTSQIDSRSNKRDGNRQGCRYYCSDGIVLDADWNAAVNIGLRANHPLSSSLPIDGKLMPLSGKALSTALTPKA